MCFNAFIYLFILSESPPCEHIPTATNTEKVHIKFLSSMGTTFTLLTYWFVVDFMHSLHGSKVILIQYRKKIGTYA
jgi:hypothetical protein